MYIWEAIAAASRGQKVRHRTWPDGNYVYLWKDHQFRWKNGDGYVFQVTGGLVDDNGWSVYTDETHPWSWALAQLALGRKVRLQAWRPEGFYIEQDKLGFVVNQNGNNAKFRLNWFYSVEWEAYDNNL